jgi:hypothetical protein
MDAGTVVAVLVAVGAIEFVRQIVTGLFSRKRNSRKAQLDDAQVIQGMSLSLLEPLHKEIEGLRARVQVLSDDLDRAHRRYEAAEAALRAHNLPVPVLGP